MTHSIHRWFAAGVAAAVTVLTTLAVGVGPAGASTGTVPFSDPDQNGLITLCDASGQRVTSGSLLATPFVVKAVSSSAAPTGYTAGLATLYAYQPIRYVDPGDWSGSQLNGSSYFSDAAHPGTESTPSDEPLVTFTGVYPLHWDGLMQLRLFYTAPGQQPYPGDYPAAVLKVTGTTWTAVQEGTTPCSATTTKSLERLDLKRSQYAPKSATNDATLGRPGAAARSRRGGRAGPTGGSASGAGGGDAAASGRATPAADSIDATSSVGSGSGSGLKVVIGLSIVAALAVVGVLFARRRSA